MPFYTAYTIWLFAGGSMDIFLSVMMFFILDPERQIDIVRDESRHVSYAVLDLIKLDGNHGSD